MVAHGQTPEGRSHSCKREHDEEPSPQGDSHSIGWKRQRTSRYPRSEPKRKYPPRLWDELSSIPLIHSALRELERSTYSQPSFASRPTLPAQDLTPTATGELARFARHGGPDLHDLRGYPHATRRHRPAGAMSANATDPTTLPTPVTAMASESTGPYSRAFEEHWTGNQARSQTYASQKPEWAEVMTALARRRPSLSYSMFSPTSFSNFQTNNTRAANLNKSAVLSYAIPTIIGQQQVGQLPGRSVLFNNLKPLAEGTIKAARPDIYYGADPSDLDRSIRDELAGYIVPSNNTRYPMAPNFFLEVKSPNVSKAEITRRACRDGAIGSRAMHSLQNYHEEQPQYDGKPYTFSSTYVSGTLNIYAHHITAPKTPGGRPEYQMTLVGSWSLLGNIDSFRSGVAAFRNARDLAKLYRDRFVKEVKARGGRCRNQKSLRVKLEPKY